MFVCVHVYQKKMFGFSALVVPQINTTLSSEFSVHQVETLSSFNFMPL